MSTVMSDRIQTRIYVTAAAKESLEQFSRETNIPQSRLHSRMCEWFAKLSKKERLHILGVLSEDELREPPSGNLPPSGAGGGSKGSGGEGRKRTAS